jgi:hypothetical protein
MLEGRVSITRSLGEEPKKLVPENAIPDGTVIDKGLKHNGGSIRLPVPIITYQGREVLFGGKEPRKYDHTITPGNKHKTRRVLVPYMENFQIVSGRPVLNMVLLRADNLIRVANRVREGTATPADLQKSANRYFDEIQRILTGKAGILTRDLFGVRCANSVRCVAVPGPDLKYFEIGVPRAAAVEAEMCNGDWVLVSRSPVLWQGSILSMKVVRIDGDAAHANPYIMQGLGLDFDGDQLSIIRTSDDPVIRDEMRAAADDPVRESFQWTEEFLINNQEPECSWTQAGLDVVTRLAPTGLSIGPKDVLDPDNCTFLSICNDGVKPLPADFSKWGHGVTLKEWCVEAEAAAMAVARLKLEIGLLGATTDKANQVVLAFGDVAMLRTALILKEQLTDAMMKNAKQGGGTGYSTSKIAALMDKRGQFAADEPHKALRYLESIGFDSDTYRPMLELIYAKGGVTEAISVNLPMIQACRTNDREAVARVIDGEKGPKSIAACIHSYTEDDDEVKGSGLVPYKGIWAAGRTHRNKRRPLRDAVRPPGQPGEAVGDSPPAPPEP